MKKQNLQLLSLVVLLGLSNAASAKDWFGGNNFFGGNNNNGCNDWPEWTPMYWMEEMMGDNNCYGGAYGSPYRYPSYQTPYAGAGAYGANPYATTNAYNPYAQQPSPYAAQYPVRYIRPQYNSFNAGVQPQPFASRGLSPFSGLGTRGLSTSPFTSFPSMGGSPFSGFGSPMTSPMGMSSFASPMTSPMGMSNFASPMSPMGMSGFTSPITSPLGMGGLTSPLSPMSMGAMPLAGISPMTPLSPRLPMAPLAPMRPAAPMNRMSPYGMGTLSSLPSGSSAFNPFR